jgi:CheY-like chemotaxis protein
MGEVHEKSAQHVLIVDDDPDIRQALAETLREDGFEVWEAEDGAVALEQLPQIPRPCLVLLDLMMPVMGGDEVLERIRQSPDPETRSLDVFIFTAGSTVKEETARRAQACFYKPFQLHELFDALYIRNH